MFVLGVAFVALTLLAGVAATPSRFDPSRVHLIDSAAATGSFLFRGNEPIRNMTFVYDELQTALANASARVGGPPVAKGLFLVDVNLLELERGSIHIEEAFFAANPHLGIFQHKPIYGALTNPLDYAESVRKIMARDLDSWSHDKLPSLMTWLHDGLTSKYHNSVIYVHCEAGEDRTGEVSGSYYMRYLGMSFDKALSIDNTNTNRDIRCASARALLWYCFHLQGKGMPVGSCIPQNQTYCSHQN